ncbi:MAG TPA: cyclic nucleotide-binding domain-containing protein [Spirochaetota bacterium]|nr:cyclic nucleotide-binding domain-containing protein [Spirochaetota bacterium]
MNNEKRFQKGSYLFIEGDDESGAVYLVKKGRVRHHCTSPGLSAALTDAGEGDFIGFISAFSGRPRLSSAVAVVDTAAVRIESESLFTMLAEKKEIAMKIMNSYSQALQKYDHVLMGIKPITLLYPRNMSLMRLGEYYMDKGDSTLALYIFNRYIQLYPDSENLEEVEQLIDDLEPGAAVETYTPDEKGKLFYSDKSVVFCEHEPGDLLYFIEEGRVKIIKQSKNGDMLLAVLGEGEIFGELALITSTPRSATAISFGGLRVTPVDMDMFSGMLSKSPEIIRKIITSISQRLWFNHVRLSQMSYRKPVTRIFAFLETKLMEDGVSLKRKTQHQFQFGLDELIEMNELNTGSNMEEIDELVGCRWLSFNFGTITVLNPLEFTADVQMYKQRDSIPSARKVSLIRAAVYADLAEQPYNTLMPSASPGTGKDEPRGSVDPEIAGIIPLLNDEDPSKRADAVIRLGSLGEKARDSVHLLEKCLGDGEKIIRKNAARSILNILPPDESFRLFRDAVTADSQEIRSAAVSGLGELEIKDRSGIIDLLARALDDGSAIVRAGAARSLGYIGPDAGGTAPNLIRLLGDSDNSVRILAVNALEKITGHGGYLGEVITSIKKVLKDDADRFVKNAARDALIKLNRRKKTDQV